LLHPRFFFSNRSRCPACAHVLAWYDLIPIISYIFLRGRCRTCNRHISILYPITELLTAVMFTQALCHIPSAYIFPGYFFWLSCLIINARADAQEYLIPRITSIGVVPLIWLLAYLGKLPILPFNSILASFVSFWSFWLIGYLFWRVYGVQGLGEGDFDVICLIGAGIGLSGAWISLVLASILGTFWGLGVGLINRRIKQIRLPFAPFLCTGAYLYLIYHDHIWHYLTLYVS
jgi:leader peptidase (prepilin peptidase)/N-methyltransferase